MATKRTRSAQAWRPSQIFWVVATVVFFLGFAVMAAFRTWESFNRTQAEYDAQLNGYTFEAQTIALKNDSSRGIAIQSYTYQSNTNIDVNSSWLSRRQLDKFKANGKIFVSRSVWRPETNSYISQGGVLLEIDPNGGVGLNGSEPTPGLKVVKTYDTNPGSDLLQYGFSQEYVSSLQ